jgi:hypothetical protein
MSINFITFRKLDYSEKYEIIQKTFPNIEGNRFEVVSKSLGTRTSKQSAMVAAKVFALLKKNFYLPKNKSIITSVPFFSDGFATVELIHNDVIFLEGSVFPQKTDSVNKAYDISKQRNLPLILPE